MSEQEIQQRAFDLLLASINKILSDRGIAFRLAAKGEANYPTVQFLNRYLNILVNEASNE